MDSDIVMPIAIVGIGGRFPGDASDPDKLWKLLAEGRNALSKIPADRYNIDAYLHPEAARIGVQPFASANFMNRPTDAFDAPFFGIKQREADSMDPQQRMCLEVAYEALENAGIRMEDVKGSPTSVYVGAFTKDYRSMLAHDQDNLPWHFATGVADACMSNRVSWFYDLRGPSMTIDTACSSSMVALHLACQSLRNKESHMSLVGGVNFMCYPEYNVTMSTMRFLSVDSKSKAFDSKANGYGRGEGCTFVVLKPLEAALRDNDVIRAVIRNTGTNQDGYTQSLFQPSKEAQADLIRRVYREAGLSMAHTAYFEAHGTGTSTGDPIEAEALGETIGAARPSGDPLWIGSIKANIGHLEGASGLAGLIKAVYILEKAAIPPQVLYEKTPESIKLDVSNLAISSHFMPWPKEGPRRVSVNSFGFGGANAHVILDDAYHYLWQRDLHGHHNTIIHPHDIAASPSSDSAVLLNSPSITSEDGLCPFEQATLLSVQSQLDRPSLLVWSAHEQSGVHRVNQLYSSYINAKVGAISEREQATLFDRFAYTTGTRRSMLPWRAFTIASSLKELASGLEKATKPLRSHSKCPEIGFVFTGQGAQWSAMGRELLYFPVFSQSLEDASHYLLAYGCPWNLSNELLRSKDNSLIDSSAYSQPICTAIQIALVELLWHWGVKPAAVIGHSSGEIAAAFAKGAISREAAWKIAYERGRLSNEISRLAPQLEGAMLAASIAERETNRYLSRVVNGKACVACINSPTSVTLSGDQSAICELEVMLADDDKQMRRLKVATAYHSAHMQVISDAYRRSISDIQVLPEASGGPKMFSTVTGSLITNCDLGSEYWVSNMLNTVKFSDAAASLLMYSDKPSKFSAAKPFIDIFVEIGPHGALQGPLRDIISSLKADVFPLPTLIRYEDAARSLLDTCGKLFQHGYPVNIEAINNTGYRVPTKLLLDLPSFPWNHTNKYWFESAQARGHRFRKHAKDDLIGVPFDEANMEQPSWRQFLRIEENRWLEDHSVHNSLLFPACGMAAMVIQAAAQSADPSRLVDGYELKDLCVDKALVVPRTHEGVEVVLRFRPSRNGTRDMVAADWTEFTIYSRSGHGDWSRNCIGLTKTRYKKTVDTTVFTDEAIVINHNIRNQYRIMQSRCKTKVQPIKFYDHQAKVGVQLGAPFQNLTAISKGPDDSCCCNVTIPNLKEVTFSPVHYTPHVIHPVVLDSLLTTIMPVIGGEHGEAKTAAIPTSIGSLYVSADVPNTPGAVFESYGQATHIRPSEGEGYVYAALGGWDKPLVKFERVRCARLGMFEGEVGSRHKDVALRKITGEIIWQLDVSSLDMDVVQNYCNQFHSPLAQLQSLVKLMAHRNPAMDILEINVGDGHITEQVLRSLMPGIDNTPMFHTYTLTESDQEDAQNPTVELLDHPSRMISKKLDITLDPLQQGFKEGQFDLVIASNLPEHTLSNVRLLLKQGAKLVLASVVGQKLLDSLIFGSIDDNLVIPILSPERWEPLLLRDGFTGVEAAFPDIKDTKVQPFSFFTTSVQTTFITDCPPDIVIVLPSHASAEASSLASELTNFLRVCGSKTETIHMCGVLETSLSDKAVIFLIELEQPVLYNLGDVDFAKIRKTLLTAECVTWVTRGGAIECPHPRLGLFVGLLRTLRLESPGLRVNTVDLASEESISLECNIEAIVKVLRNNFINRDEAEFAVRHGNIMIPRVYPQVGANDLIALHGSELMPEPMAFKQHARALALTITNHGMLDTLHFKDDEQHLEPLDPHEVEISVRATGLNFMDIMVAMGQVREPAFGLECSGVVNKIGPAVTKFKVGDHVMTWLLGGFSNYARNHESMMQTMAPSLDFPTAASLPMVYTTAYASLVEEARLEKDEKILIHAAAGGVGQAAIQIAQHLGAEVFATVSSEAKKRHIMKEYSIPADHIFNSRDDSFADGIRRMTNGGGVDVVLNCLAGEAMKLSFACLGWFGRFVELGKKDIVGNSGLDMATFSKNTSYHAVNIIGTLQHSVRRASRLFQKAMNFINLGFCRPITPLNIMGMSQIEEGFRKLQNGTHMGKTVFVANDKAVVPAIPHRVVAARFDPQSTYVVSGGFGGIGRTLCLWMAENGVKNLAVITRTGLIKPQARAAVDALVKTGTNVRVFTCDVGDAEALRDVAREIQSSMPPVQGIVQAAMSLADVTYTNMTSQQWRYSLRTKAKGTWNLHQYFPKQLEFFIMLSSSSGVVGNPGQANYAAGNAFQDALASYRRGQGYKAVALDLGPVIGAGHVEEHADLIDSLTRQGVVALHIDEVIALIQAAITGESIIGHEMPGQLITGFATGGYATAEGWDSPTYHQDARFSYIRVIDVDTSMLSASKSATWQAQLSRIESVSDAAELVVASLRDRLSKLMMVVSEDIDLDQPVSKYGVDSLTAVEIRTWCSRELQSDISIFDVTSNVSMASLARTIAKKSKFIDKEIIEADH